MKGEDSSEPETGSTCTRCHKPGKLQCPKCLELKLPRQSSVFCSQECFKSAWREHKELHKPTAWQYCTQRGKGRSASMPLYKWSGPLRPFPIGPVRTIPDGIPQPDYSVTGVPTSEIESRQQQSVPVRSGKSLDGIRRACKLGREVLDRAHAAVRPGVTTDDIDRVVHEATIAAGAYPSPLNYFNFPKSCCTSVNEVVCHGVPDRRPLESGDIVNVDISVFYQGYHADLNETFVVGEVDDASKRLIKATYECLMNAIKAVKPGLRYRDVGEVITQHAQANGLSVVKSYCGHGIGDLFHCAPNIPHYAHNKAVGIMKVGHVFTIEPMINMGIWKDKTWPDGWTVATMDGKRSAQFEHTMVVTEQGCEVLTARLPNSPPLWWEAAGAAPEASTQVENETC